MTRRILQVFGKCSKNPIPGKKPIPGTLWKIPAIFFFCFFTGFGKVQYLEKKPIPGTLWKIPANFFLLFYRFWKNPIPGKKGNTWNSLKNTCKIPARGVQRWFREQVWRNSVPLFLERFGAWFKQLEFEKFHDAWFMSRLYPKNLTHFTATVSPKKWKPYILFSRINFCRQKWKPY